ncbi:hypothetical protein H920_15194 [Fukomys damarensis]|uniref:Uncharacterized protein n=1 Tax=Fukomys damarensis TaxID=885580 RepID=A0A091CV21_FUKDA|nr:hypothetical protein H920_15194 [Fukomys damarensis]
MAALMSGIGLTSPFHGYFDFEGEPGASGDRASYPLPLPYESLSAAQDPLMKGYPGRPLSALKSPEEVVFNLPAGGNLLQFPDCHMKLSSFLLIPYRSLLL